MSDGTQSPSPPSHLGVPPPLPDAAQQPGGAKSPPPLSKAAAQPEVAPPASGGGAAFFRKIGRGANWLAVRMWRGLAVVGEFYWTQRRALRQRFAEYLSASQNSKNRPREIRLDARDDRRHAHFIEGRWTVKLPDCCAVCGAATESASRDERRDVPDLTASLWAPLAGVALGLALCCVSVWLFPLGLLAGFVAGYFLRRSVPVQARLRRCEEHAGLSTAPQWFAHGDNLVIRTGHAQVVERFFAENRAPGAAAKPYDAAPTSAAAPRPLDDAPIPLADGAQPVAVSAAGRRDWQTGYAAECFEIEFEEQSDSRESDVVAGGKAVYEAANAGRTDDALKAVLELKQREPDYDFVYCWLGTLLQRQGKPREAEQALHEGLRVARRKWSLCDYLGDLHWERRDLRGAVRWWLRSAVLQVFTENLRDQSPFLYLAEVAGATGLHAQRNTLLDIAGRIRRDVGLSPQAAQQLTQAAREDRQPADLKAVVERLVHEYLAPGASKPAPPRYPNAATTKFQPPAEGYALAPEADPLPPSSAPVKEAASESPLTLTLSPEDGGEGTKRGVPPGDDSAYHLARDPAAAPAPSRAPASPPPDKASSRADRLSAYDTVAMICQLKGPDFAAPARCDICSEESDIPRGFVQMSTSANAFIGVKGWWIITHQQLRELPDLMGRGAKYYVKRTRDRSVAKPEKWIAWMEKNFGQTDWLLCPRCAALAGPDAAEWDSSAAAGIAADSGEERELKPRTAASLGLAISLAVLLGVVFYWIGDSLSQFVAGFQADADGETYPRWIGPSLGGLVALLVILGYLGSTTAAKPPTSLAESPSDSESDRASASIPPNNRPTNTVFSQFAGDLRCQHCGKSHGTTEWPEAGDMVPFYYQQEPGRHSLRVACPHCGKSWYVVWDDNPGPIGRVLGT